MRTEPRKASRRNVEGTTKSFTVLRTSHSSKNFSLHIIQFFEIEKIVSKRNQPTLHGMEWLH